MELDGGPSISDELLERKRRVAREIFGEMEADERRQKHSQNSQTFIEVIGLAFAVAGVVLSLYGSIFAEKEEGLKGLWKVLWGPGEIQEIKLSDLMQQQPNSESDKPARRIYIFALDVSGSTQTGKVTEEDWKLFTDRVQSDGLQMCEGLKTYHDGMTRWHLARAQTCCYLKSLREGDFVGLWKFGADAIPIYEKYKLVNHERTEEVDFREIHTSLMDSNFIPPRGSVDFKTTNFENLLDTLHKAYMEGQKFKDYNDYELHFVILSDFMHDIGPKGQLSYSTSMQKIADRFHSMGRLRHAMFHLVAITVGNQEVNSVVPIAEEAAGWYQYRFDSFDRPSTRSKSLPDFFYGFAKSPKNIVFYHMAGSSNAVPVRLIWEEEKGDLTVGLMTDVYSASDQDLAVHVAEGWPGVDCSPLEHSSFSLKKPGKPIDMQTGILRPKGRQSLDVKFEVKRPHDYICVQPLSVERERIYNYKLTLSRPGQIQERSIYLVDVDFQQYLPPLAAWTLVICAVAIAVASVCWVFIYEGDRVKSGIGRLRGKSRRGAEPAGN